MSREVSGFISKLLEPMGISTSQADFLYLLLRGDKQPSSIAQAIGIDASNLSRMIRQFEEQGWVTRGVDETNRTRVEITLTDEGRAFAEKISGHADVVHETLHSDLTPKDIEALTAIFAKISGSIARGPVREWPTPIGDQ
jgi:DNA-binding MarR family transcriptional regulator